MWQTYVEEEKILKGVSLDKPYETHIGKYIITQYIFGLIMSRSLINKESFYASCKNVVQ